MRRLTQAERLAIARALQTGTDLGQSRAQAAAAQAAVAERARIVAMLRYEADHGPVGTGAACRYAADLIEREGRP